MKKIAIQLGLIEASTEAQILTAIKELQGNIKMHQEKAEAFEKLNNGLQSTADEIQKISQQVITENEGLNNENQILKEELGNLKNEVAGKDKQISMLESAISELESTNPDAHLSIDDLREKAVEIMKAQSLDKLFMASDGVPFYTENDAKIYATKNQLTVVPFGTEG